MLVLSPAKQDEGPTETESHFRALDAEDNETGFFFDSCFVCLVLKLIVFLTTYFRTRQVSYYKTVLNFSALRPLHTFFEKYPLYRCFQVEAVFYGTDF